MKNKRGLGIHFFYCEVRRFTKLPTNLVDSQQCYFLFKNAKFIPLVRYEEKYFKFAIKDEVGMLRGERYICHV